MPELKADVVVLGAGMVDVGAGLHLQRRGRDVMLVDRHNAAGEETSYGNAGLIECTSVFPYMFRGDCGRLLAEMMTGETPFADPSPFAVGGSVDHRRRLRSPAVPGPLASQHRSRRYC